jgi:hypothetical protein
VRRMAAPASFLHEPSRHAIASRRGLPARAVASCHREPSRHVIASRRSTSRPEYVNDSGHRTVKGDTMHRLDPVGAAA